MIKQAQAPQSCPECGEPANILNPRPRYWYVACSNNSEVLGGHRVIGHAMHTKRDAIGVWNDMKPRPARTQRAGAPCC